MGSWAGIWELGLFQTLLITQIRNDGKGTAVNVLRNSDLVMMSTWRFPILLSEETSPEGEYGKIGREVPDAIEDFSVVLNCTDALAGRDEMEYLITFIRAQTEEQMRQQVQGGMVFQRTSEFFAPKSRVTVRLGSWPRKCIRFFDNQMP